MAAPKKEINLLPQDDWEKKPIGKIVKWALTFGRYIVVITELIVIVCFVSRFSLDREISDIYEEVEAKQIQVQAYHQFENDFRLTQKQLKTIKELWETKDNAPEITTNIRTLIPLNITLEKIAFNGDSVNLSGSSLSESGIATLITNFNQSPLFENVQMGNITKDNRLEINFSLSAKLSFPVQEEVDAKPKK